MISPDGHWIAYQSNESGIGQIYVQAFPDGHGKRKISGDRGSYPEWSRDGRELFFWRAGVNGYLMVVPFEPRGDSFLAGPPRVWSEQVPVIFSATQAYNGKHVVALMPADPTEERHDRVIFLLNFFDELRRRVPLSSN